MIIMRPAISINPENINARKLPALSESSILRYLTFSAMYVAQGIPEGILWFGLPAWMAMNGVSAGQIGAYVAVIGLPWSFKIIAAPIMDRFTFLAMGRRRPWIIFGQFGLMASFLSMAFIPDPLHNMTLLMIAGFTVSLFGIIQDISVDGLAIDILPVNQQARANGVMWGSKTLGIALSLAVGVYIINNYGFFYAITSFSLAISVIMIIPLVLRERPGEKLLPWSFGTASETSSKLQVESWKQLFKSLVKVFFLPVSILMGIAVFSFNIGRGVMDTLLPVFSVQELGWTDSYYSNLTSVAKIVAGVSGMLIAGALIDFFGKIRMLTIYLISLIILISMAVIFKSTWQSQMYTTGFLLAYHILETFITIGIFAVAMVLCWKKVSATQFTLYMAISNLGKSLGSGLLGTLKNYLDWDYVILASIIFPLVMLVLIRYIHFANHAKRLEGLEVPLEKDKG